MKFGAQIRRLRLEAGLSQEKLARELGVSLFTVSRYERDTYPPGVERLNDIAAVLGVDIAELLEEEAVA